MRNKGRSLGDLYKLQQTRATAVVEIKSEPLNIRKIYDGKERKFILFILWGYWLGKAVTKCPCLFSLC